MSGRRLPFVAAALLGATLAGVGLATGAGAASRIPAGIFHSEAPTAARPAAPATHRQASATPSHTPTTTPRHPATSDPTTKPRTTKPRTSEPRHSATPAADLADVQRRLRQLGLYDGPVTGVKSQATTTAIRRFQAKFGLPVVGVAGPRTSAKLTALTAAGSAIDPRCDRPGRVICVDKSQRILRAMADGRVVRSVDVRFGSDELPTREGAFSIYRKSRDHVSTLFHTPMPFAMFFSGGEAVHYSRDFAARGYAGNSHGCINVRSQDSIRWLFDWAPVGTPVYVYRSS